MPDTTDIFTCEGRHLREWLPLMVADNKAARLAAGEVVAAMFVGVPSAYTDITDAAMMPDADRRKAAFNSALRQILAEPSFPKREFVNKLCRLIIQVQQSWNAEMVGQMREENARIDRVATKIQRRMSADPSPENLQKESARLVRVLSHGCDSDDCLKHEAMHMGHMAARWTFEALGEELLEAADSLEFMLESSGLRHDGLEALTRIGSAACGRFAPWLMQQLDLIGETHWFNGHRALASIARGSADLAAALRERLRAPSHEIAARAAATLGFWDAEADQLAPGITDALLARCEVIEAGLGYYCIEALGAYAASRPDVLDRLVRFVECGTTEQRGAAIDALGRSGPATAHRALPALLDAITTFQEFDPDWCYHSSKGRVVAALRQLGPAAVAAVPKLLPYIRFEDGGVDSGIAELFLELGPPARVALPALKDLAADMQVDLSEPDDLLARTIRRIEG